ncbi:MAG: replication-associated recombination protein A [Puniceicoccales bacterium]|nr:replication-associated recombination protein A [Puniceicoccales bacterium]
MAATNGRRRREWACRRARFGDTAAPLHCATMPDETFQTQLFHDDDGAPPDNGGGAETDGHGFRPPLAARMRPRSLAEVRGHENLLGAGGLLPRLVNGDTFGSLIFYGPPGCGKTTLAEVIATASKCRVTRVNAVLSNTGELREILRAARFQPGRRTVLLIDEIHRFNKAQQDLLLPDVEAGNVRLIGCTTHNPGFYVNPPLLSRSHLFRLEPLGEDAVLAALRDALADTARGLGASGVTAADEVLLSVARMTEGDMRRALNALETLVAGHPLKTPLTQDDVAVFARERRLRYDRGEDEHYDTASAFIKSIRGSDPDAAVYWLAVMLEGGEDPRFIARRLVILASEDIGLADSRALTVAISAQQACDFVGLPECALTLAHCVLFLASCPKSNSAMLALAAAQSAVRNEPRQPVPAHLRDAHTKLNKSLGQGAGYLYSHDFSEGISGQDYLSRPLKLYTPKNSGAEAAISERLARWETLRAQLRKKKGNA